MKLQHMVTVLKNAVRTLVRDTFTAANGTTLHGRTPELGADVWEVTRGTFDIQSNRANCATVGAGEGIVTTDSGQSDCTVEVIANAPAGSFVGLVVRWVDAQNWWLVIIQPTADAFEIYEYNATSYTARATASVTIDADTDYTIKVILRGNTITATLNGANQISYASATLGNTSTKHGLRSDTALARFDNFKVTKP